MNRFKKPSLFAFAPAALVLALSAAACSEPETPPAPAPVSPAEDTTLSLGEAENGGTKSATVGQDIILTLPENLSTGYTWQPLDPVDAAVLTQTGDTEIPPDEAVPGAPGQHEWTFTAAGPGTTKIVLASVPPGEEVSQKYESYSVTVEVKEAA